MAKLLSIVINMRSVNVCLIVSAKRLAFSYFSNNIIPFYL